MSMSTSDLAPDRLVFRGSDADECEEFIAAVINHAYDQGRQDDDKWITDFVATRLAKNALRWWSGLDQQVRENWDSLRRAMLLRYQPQFRGKDGEEAEEFVWQVRQRARDAGKQKDNDWIITFVSDCFVGDALRWYTSLESGIQQDWKVLQAAILQQYPRDDARAQAIALNIPTPAQAAPAPLSTVKKGRLRGCPTNHGSVNKYISRLMDRSGQLPLTNNVTEALVVEYDSSLTGAQPLKIPDGQIAGFDAIGAKWSYRGTISTSNVASLAAIYLSNATTSVDSSCSGRPITHIWNISSTPTGTGQAFPVTLTYGSGPLVAQSDLDLKFMELKHMGGRKAASRVAVDIFFEPV